MLDWSMEPNIPKPQITVQDIRLMILESWVQGEVAESVPGYPGRWWVAAAEALSEDLDIHLEPPYVERSTDVVYLRANHGFPLEMHWQSPEARQWLQAVPERVTQRNLWNDMFLERGGLA